jgi:phosphopantothenoylcysteine synthetase/decarboxylase
MNVLVTAGNTLVPIDRVRCITNVFTGRTGTSIALHFYQHGHNVRLLTSYPEVTRELSPETPLVGERWQTQVYRTFDDLAALMEQAVRQSGVNIVIHSAAVSDYRSAGIYAPVAGTRFYREDCTWIGERGKAPALVDRGAAKVKSDEPELWLRLVRAPKLIDAVRAAWGFRGVLVKFKLEVGIGEEQLLQIAESSRRHSQADLMVANTLEGAATWALLGPVGGGYQRVSRRELPRRLLEAVEQLHTERNHG